MTCADCTTRLDDHVDRELGADDARAVEAHVAGCPACHAQLAALQSLLAQTRALPCAIAPAPISGANSAPRWSGLIPSRLVRTPPAPNPAT